MNDEEMFDDTISMGVNIPKNEKEAIQTGAELGQSLFDMAAKIRDSMNEKGASSHCSGNAILHGYIVALSYITTVILYEMEGTPMPSFEELDVRNRPIFKKLVDSVGDIITENAKRGHLIRINKDSEEKGDQ